MYHRSNVNTFLFCPLAPQPSCNPGFLLSLQMRPPLQRPPLLLLPLTPLQHPLLIRTQPSRRIQPLGLLPPIHPPHGLLPQLLPQLIRQPDYSCTHRRPIPSVLPLPPARSNLFGKVPQLPRRGQVTRHLIPPRPPLGRHPEPRGDPRVFRPDHLDDPLLLEPLVRVLQRFLVYGFKVGEVALVVEGFAQLSNKC